MERKATRISSASLLNWLVRFEVDEIGQDRPDHRSRTPEDLASLFNLTVMPHILRVLFLPDSRRASVSSAPTSPLHGPTPDIALITRLTRVIYRVERFG